MIKILRPGTRKEAECPSCGALLSYDISDILEKSSHSIAEASSVHNAITKLFCQQLDKKGVSMSDIDKCISVLIKLSKSFGIDAKALPPCFNHITVTFEKKTCDGTPWRLNYAFELWLLKDLDTCQLQEYFKYVFFDKILESFIEYEKEVFNIEESL